MSEFENRLIEWGTESKPGDSLIQMLAPNQPYLSIVRTDVIPKTDSTMRVWTVNIAMCRMCYNDDE